MRYLNPLSILELPSETTFEAITPTFLRQQKRRLLAEFDLSTEPTIDVSGRELDRATVLKMFDELAEDHLRKVHFEIQEMPALSAFLEDASLTYFYEGEVAQLPAQSKALLSYIGPYFAHAYNKRLLHAFKQSDWEEIQVLCQHPLTIPPEYQAEAYKDTYRLLHGRVDELEAFAEEIEKGKEPSGKLQEYVDEMAISSINELPVYFSGIRDKYAMGLENLALAVYNKHERVQLGMFVLRQGLKLNLTPGVAARLQELLDIMVAQNPLIDSFETMKETLGGGSGKKNNWWVVVGIGTVISVLVWLFI